MDCFSNHEEGKKGIKRLQPDLVFLNVQLKDRTGFKLLEELDEINFPVLFY